MRMVIAGGRDFINRKGDIENVYKAVKQYGITEIVSGDAKGADFFGEYCAEMLDIPVKKFPADWKTYGKMAGPQRNGIMAQYTDYVFLFKGGKGTANMRNEALIAGKKIVYDNGWVKR